MGAKRVAGVSGHDLDQLCALFRLLSDKTRLGIVLRLAEGERNVTSLCHEMKMPQPTISHHLALLRMSNVVGSRRQGKQVIYALHGADGLSDGNLMEFAVQNLAVLVRSRSR